MSSVTGKAFNLNLLKRVFSYVKPYKNIFYTSAVITISLAVLSPLRPWLVQYTLDHYVVKPNLEMLFNMTLLLVGLLVLEGIMQFADTYFSNLMGQSVIRDLRVNVYKHVIGLRLKYFDNTPIGVLVTRTISDIETIADIFSEGIVVIIGDILKLMVIIGVMFYSNVKLTFICLSTIPLLIISANVFKNAVQVAFQEVRNQVAKLNSFVQEHITGMNIVQIFNREQVEYEKFKEINKLHRDANIKSIWHYSVFFPVVEILSSISIGLLIWWGGKNVIQQISSPGEIVAFIMYINMLFRPIRQLADRFNTLQMGMVGSERVFKLLDNSEKIVNTGQKDVSDLKGNIEFKNIWFAYNDEDWVLKNVSFTVNEGETVALVGATGSGKSSIVNLINRFYEYNKGDILIDGIDLREYNSDKLKSKMALVLQDVFLFSDTIENNITLNNPNINHKTVYDAAKAIGANEFIEKLPNQYQYNVMERGSMLSVGQRQLIAFMRAYVYQPKILILDEATSSIDTESEQLIQKAIDTLTYKRTSIIVAHRLATIQKANKIIVLDRGEIVEQGTHKELLKNNGYYKRLFDLQFKEL